MQPLLKIILCFSLLALSISCDKKQDETKEIKRTVLIMGTTSDYPPFQSIKNKKITGFDIDLANIIAKKLGYSIYLKDMNFDTLIEALQTQKIDFALAAFSITEERSKYLEFSESYYTPEYVLLYNKTKVIKTLEDLKDKTVGVQIGTTMEEIAKSNANKIKNIEVIPLSRTMSIVRELVLKRLDCIIIEKTQADIIIRKYNSLGYKIIPQYSGKFNYAIAFPKNSSITKQFNTALTSMKKSGELQKLIKHWNLEK